MHSTYIDLARIAIQLGLEEAYGSGEVFQAMGSPVTTPHSQLPSQLQANAAQGCTHCLTFQRGDVLVFLDIIFRSYRIYTYTYRSCRL